MRESIGRRSLFVVELAEIGIGCIFPILFEVDLSFL